MPINYAEVGCIEEGRPAGGGGGGVHYSPIQGFAEPSCAGKDAVEPICAREVLS